MPTPTILTITNAILTAYCGCGQHPQCPTGTLTAIGRSPVQGRTVAVSRQIPLNSTVSIRSIATQRRISQNAIGSRFWFVENHATYRAEDRFNKRFELSTPRRVDIYFGTNHADAIKFGKQKGTVTYTIYGRP